MSSPIKEVVTERQQFADEKPFSLQLSDDDVKQKDDVMISVRLNLDDQEMLKAIKESFNITSDGMALKVSARLGLNVIRQMFPSDFLEYLTREKRARLRKK